MTAPRIGVFICHCGNNIGGVVSVPEVVGYSKNLPYVVYAEDNIYTCSEEGISSIKDKIKKFDLNRVVVAACTPRTHQTLFRNACADAGLNKYLFEFVNIREHCSWIHSQNREEATEKAKDLVKMGIAKARWLEEEEEIESAVYPAAMVIGGGVAGMSAARSLANQGFDVHLVEKERKLGGLLRSVDRIFPTNEKTDRLLEPIIKEVESCQKIKRHMAATVKSVNGYIGNFDIIVEEKGKETRFEVGVIIMATGAEEFKPVQYGYGRFPNVVTQLDLEQKLRRGLKKAGNVVMINCVGARVPERPYCSRFCCLTAIKNATLLKEGNPSANIYILHRDLMTYGVTFEEYYRSAREAGVKFIRYTLDAPPHICGDERVKTVTVYDELMGENVELPTDLLVLTTPLVPPQDNESLSKMLKVPLGDGGFFLEAHIKLRPVELVMDGVYVCGCARWPADITESISQGYAAAAKAAIPMSSGSISMEAITAAVDGDICQGCGNCALVCPFDAIEIRVANDRSTAEVNLALCKGCGLCTAACPSGAIQQRGFTDQQMLSIIDVLTGKRSR